MYEIVETAPARKRDNNSIRAELIGANTCTAAGIAAQAVTPVLALCRGLIAADLDPDTALAVHRGAVLALRERSIGDAAGLTIKDDNRGCLRGAAWVG